MRIQWIRVHCMESVISAKNMGCRLSQKSTLQNHTYRNTFTEFSAHLAISSDDLAKSSAHLARVRY